MENEYFNKGKTIHAVIYEKAFQSVGREFTSHEFGKEVKRIIKSETGYYPKYRIRGGEYLHTVAIQTSLRRWVKNQIDGKKSFTGTIEEFAYSWDESKAIAYLKSKGYKIMKPVNQWEEV
jgi:hypothetical protein